MVHLDANQDSAPRPQPPEECHRYPGRDCPGECQYILGPDDCANEIEEKRRGLVSPRRPVKPAAKSI